ncbi:hypothetical protein M8494_01325 [Serratia ureilytica]
MKAADGLRISMWPFAFVAKNTWRPVHRRRHDRQLPGAAVRPSATPPYIDASSQHINTRTLGLRLDSAGEIAQAAGQVRARRSATCLISPAVANVMLDIQTKVHLDSDRLETHRVCRHA